MQPSVRLGEALSPAELETVALGAPLLLDERHWAGVLKARAFLEQLVGQRRRLYGVTTGYGPLAETYVDPAASAQLQCGLVQHLSAGVGPDYPRHWVRAIMAARIATLARGHSAIRPEALSLLLECLNGDLVPLVPAMGTVGASGDLTPLAHIARALMGEGEVLLRGQRMGAAAALRQLGLNPLDPQGKDALALVNGTSAMTAIAGLNVCRSGRVLKHSAVLSVLYGELLGGRVEAFQPGLSHVRPHPGQVWAQDALLAMAQSSDRLGKHEQPPPRLPDDLAPGTARGAQPLPQDAYTFRCAPQHLGAVADTLGYHRRVVEQELAAVTDNPVFFPDTGEVLHGGNFFGQHIALAADALNNALVTLAVHSERRIARITDPLLNGGLPPFMRGNDNGLHSGFMGAQVSATALVAELRTHAQPASIQSIPTNANNQDVVTLGTIAARRCGESLDRLHELLAIETLILVQAYEQRGGADKGFCSATQQLADWVRTRVPPLTDDRALAPEIRALADALDHPDCPIVQWIFDPPG